MKKGFLSKLILSLISVLFLTTLSSVFLTREVFAGFSCSGTSCIDDFNDLQNPDTSFYCADRLRNEWNCNDSVPVGFNTSDVNFCGALSGASCIGLGCSLTTPGICRTGDGQIVRSFQVIKNATYRVRIYGTVFDNGDSTTRTGLIMLYATDGVTTWSNGCGSACLDTGTTLRDNGGLHHVLAITDIKPTTNTLTVRITGFGGDCVFYPSGESACSGPGIDDFELLKTADPPTAPPTSSNDKATCTDISINNGGAIVAGQTYSAKVSMKNNGTTTWTWNPPNPYRLGSQDTENNTTWGINRVDLPTSPISPGNTANFSFDVTAPSTSGTYPFNWKMVKEEVAWFGDKCQPTNDITVSASLAARLDISCSPNPTSTTTNTDITWTATAVGGEGSHNYTWAGDANLSGSGTKTVVNTVPPTPTTHSITKSYATAGTKAARVKVTSTDGQDTGFVDCSPSATISEPFNYSLNTPSNITVTQGSSGSTTIRLTKTAGTTQSVSATSSTTLPAGATKSISSACNPDCSITFTIDTSNSTPVDTYPISVTTVSTTPQSLANKSTSFNLIVQASTGGPVPTVNIKANNSEGPVSIAHNTAATLSWTTTNSPTSCTGSGSWSGSKSTVSGSTASTSNLAGPNSYSYTLTCSNDNGSNSDTVTVNVAAAPGVAACSLSASPSSGIGSFPSTITVTYANLASVPGSVTLACGTGTNATASGCTSTNGSCTTTCTYPAVSSTTTYNATASIGTVTCSPTTVTDNPPGGGGSSCPWIQTIGGSVHSNTGINVCSN